MEEEPVAKRRCLARVNDETFCIGSGPASLQSQPREGFFKVHHNSNLSGLDHLSHVQEEVAHNGVQPIADAAGELDIDHGTNKGCPAPKADSEVCFGMVRHPVLCLIWGVFQEDTDNQCLVYDPKHRHP